MRARWLALLALPALALAQPAPLARGLYAVSALTGEATPLGAYHCPSVDGEGRWLYAADGQGAIVRWRLNALTAAPAVFAKAPPKEPAYGYPVAAPAGGLVGLTRLQEVKHDVKLLYTRVCVEVLNAQGQSIAGPLPLARTELVRNRALAFVWHPEGEKMAFSLVEGNSQFGTYVFTPATKYWAMAEPIRQVPEQLPLLQWQPNGRSLSLIERGRLWLRGGSYYASYRSWSVKPTLHTWLDSDTIALLDPVAGMQLQTITGDAKGTLGGWCAGSADELSLPVSNAKGVAWVGPVTTGGLALWYLAPKETAPKALATFARGSAPYGRAVGGPVWMMDEPLLFVEVP